MTISETFYREFESLPESLKLDALNYVKSLKTKVDYIADAQSVREASSLSKAVNVNEDQNLLFALMSEIAERETAFSTIDIMAWQKNQRQDRPLAYENE